MFLQYYRAASVRRKRCRRQQLCSTEEGGVSVRPGAQPKRKAGGVFLPSLRGARGFRERGQAQHLHSAHFQPAAPSTSEKGERERYIYIYIYKYDMFRLVHVWRGDRDRESNGTVLNLLQLLSRGTVAHPEACFVVPREKMAKHALLYSDCC